jgi:hypothetical protein
MQIKKAGVVATGALATMAIMGAPAAAAPHTDASALTNTTVLSQAGVQEANTAAIRQIGANQFAQARGGGNSWGGWDAPWDIEPQAVLSAGSSSVVNVNPFQSCGSTAANAVGVPFSTFSPNTVLGGCASGNIKITQSDSHPLIGVLDDSAVAALTNQACGSTASFAAGAAISLQSPNTVFGPCDNGNVFIGKKDHFHKYTQGKNHDGDWAESGREEAKNDVSAQALRAAWAARQAQPAAPAAARGGGKGGGKGWDAPWDVEPFGLASVGSGSSALLATWQACGSTAAFGAGAAASVGSPNTVLDDCKNANVQIVKDGPKALASILDNSSINALAWQACGSTSAAGVGAAVALQSPNTVLGSCYNANTVIR